MNEPKPIHRVTPEANRTRRAAYEALSEEAPSGTPDDEGAFGGVARSEPEASGVHRAARGRAGKRDVVNSGSTLDFTTRSHATRLLNVGYGNLIAAARIVAIVAPNASPMRRLRHDAAQRGKLVDASEGRRTRSIVILDSDHVVLSAINPETLAARLAEDGAESHA